VAITTIDLEVGTMAKRTLIVDDYDGKSEGAETVVFGVNGEYYEIDLAAASLKKLTDAVTPFIEKGRSISAKDALKSTKENGGPEVDLGAIREWAAAQTPPIVVAPKGRIAADVVTQYLAANPTPTE
jgi:Lsr2